MAYLHKNKVSIKKANGSSFIIKDTLQPYEGPNIETSTKNTMQDLILIIKVQNL